MFDGGIAPETNLLDLEKVWVGDESDESLVTTNRMTGW